MARPKMKFLPDEARTLLRELYLKLSDYDFCESHVTRGPDSDTLVFEAREALKPLWAMYEKSAPWNKAPEPFPVEGCELLRHWLETYITPKGWQRILAAKRQRIASKRNSNESHHSRETSVTMGVHPSYQLGALAAELGIDKKELLNRLPDWFSWDEKGQAAFQAFSATVRIEQRAKGLELLEAVFPLAAHQVKRIVFEAADLDPVRERELHRAAFFAGKPRLTRLAKVLKALPVPEQLKTMVTVKREEKLLLELVSTGELAAVFEALGVSEKEDPLAAGVVAFEEVLKSDAVVALANGLEASVPEDAVFGKFRPNNDNE